MSFRWIIGKKRAESFSLLARGREGEKRKNDQPRGAARKQPGEKLKIFPISEKERGDVGHNPPRNTKGKRRQQGFPQPALKERKEKGRGGGDHLGRRQFD